MPRVRLVKGCCPLDCQDTCAWVAEVVDGRVQRVRGAKEHPYTRGVLCTKVNHYEERTYSPDRLLHPLRRVGAKGSGQFEQLSWDDALDEIAERFSHIIEEWGAEALLPHRYLGSMGIIQMYALQRVFHALGASRQGGSICGGALTAGLIEMGLEVDNDPEDIVNAELIILWGANPLSTNHHLWHFIQEARRRNGAQVVAIDPRSTRTTRQADVHLPIRINSDIVLALALGHVILTEGLQDEAFLVEAVTGLETYRRNVSEWSPERAEMFTGIPARTIRELARSFAIARPATIKTGVNFGAHSVGSELMQAVTALTILCGHWRVLGGGLLDGSTPRVDYGKAMGTQLGPQEVRMLNVGALGETLTTHSLTPPIKGLMIWGTNPMIVQPNVGRVQEGLMRDDLFTVVLEHFMTDTARYADIVLPSTTQLEHFDVLGSWGHRYVTINQPAIEPLGESRSHGWVARELSRRLGLPEFSDEEIIDDLLPEWITLEELLEKGWVKDDYERELPKVKLDFTVRLPKQAPTHFPLTLIAPKGHYTMNSSLINQPRHQKAEGQPTLEMHTTDAAARCLQDGNWVRIFNDQGEIRATLQTVEQMQRGVVVLPGRWWFNQAGNTAPTNLLTPSDVAGRGQPTYNECFVEVQASTASADPSTVAPHSALAHDGGDRAGGSGKCRAMVDCVT
ncbi:MAG: molybdopterin-dependent oxidoreductase [Chloroflexota bacterium]|nr:molybdopterin-dependent oxidoreductase [Chloroflexota bacterium]